MPEPRWSSFDSGLRWHMGSLCVSGAYPEWTLRGEDGGGGSCNDVTVRITVEPVPEDCPPDAFLADPRVQEALRDLWEDSKVDAPQEERNEQAAWVIRTEDGFDLVRIDPIRSDACSIAFLPRPPIGTVALVHSHPFKQGENPRPGVCEKAPDGGERKSGVSLTDYRNLETIELRSGLDLFGLVLESTGIFRYDFDNPERTRKSSEPFDSCRVHLQGS